MKKGFTPLEIQKSENCGNLKKRSRILGQQDGHSHKFLTGFTLIELLVAIAIIGILATIALVTLNDARRKGRDVTRVAEMHQLQVALAIYYDTSGGYPGGGGICGGLPFELEPGYVNALPTDPGGGSLAYLYGAASASTTQDYVLRADLENTGHSALGADVDGTVLGCDCADTNGYFCVQP